MAKFKYIALDKEGRELSGVIESTSENRARKDLAAQGFRYRESRKWPQ